MSKTKSWDRPWSMDEIIENSENWNLAGDVALLNTLKAFADNLIIRTTEISNNLQNLTNNLSQTSLELDIAQNEFQSLRNSQFIESRVYEDDETLQAVVDENKTEAEEKNEDKTEEIRLAALKGLEVIDKYFEKLEVSVSDSEDEDINLPNYVLRPKDLYIERPLPYIIGTTEWHKSWHVGLEDSSSDSETEKVSENFSESDSESDLPIIQDRSQIKGTSDTSSELDFSQKTDSENSVPVQAPISGKNFAEELAAKLGHVIDQNYPEPEVNNRPIQTKPQYGDLFFDEPPPLDEPKGLFSGGQGLFDDDETSSSTPKPNINEDIFAKKSAPYLTTFPKMPLFCDEPPPDLDEIKKPIGGVSIFGGGNLFDKKLLRRLPNSEDDEVKDLFEEKKEKKKVNLFESDEEEESSGSGLFSSNNKINIEETKKAEKPKISLFDDNDDLFKDDIFSANTKKKFTSGLFDDVTGDDLFTQEKTTPKNYLFEDLMAIPDNKNSINSDNKTETTKKETPPPPDLKPRLSLFDSPPPESDDLLDTPTEAPPTQPEFTSTPQKPMSDLKLFNPSRLPDDEINKSTNDVEEAKNKKIDFKINKPGKLKYNLNINVGALRPGAIPSRRTDGTNNVTSMAEETSTTETIDKKSLDETDQVTILPSVTKDRAKVLNRRPSTRRGRKAAMKNSTSDFKLDQDETEKNVLFEEPSSEPSSVTSRDNLFKEDQVPVDTNREKNIFAASNDDDIFVITSQKRDLDNKKVEKQTFGLFDEPPDDDLFDFTSDDQKISYSDNKNDSVFGESPKNERDDDLFGKSHDWVNSGIAEIKNEAKSGLGLFDEPPDDDLFDFREEKSSGKEIFEKSPDEFQIESEKSDPKNKKQKTSLFDDEPPTVLFDEIACSSENINEKFNKPPADLFEKNTKKNVKKSTDSDIFGDEDDYDDLFSIKKLPVQTNKGKKSLFDDDNEEDDDDDIFKSFSSASVQRPVTKIATEKKLPKVSIKKLENTKSDDDPLTALLK